MKSSEAKQVLKKIGRKEDIPYFEKLLQEGFAVFQVYNDKVILVTPEEIAKDQYNYRGNYTIIEISKEKVETVAGYWDCGGCSETIGSVFKTVPS